jgi:hypothetical protein
LLQVFLRIRDVDASTKQIAKLFAALPQNGVTVLMHGNFEVQSGKDNFHGQEIPYKIVGMPDHINPRFFGYLAQVLQVCVILVGHCIIMISCG